MAETATEKIDDTKNENKTTVVEPETEPQKPSEKEKNSKESTEENKTEDSKSDETTNETKTEDSKSDETTNENKTEESKSDETTNENKNETNISEQEAKIIRQIEYYFGDANLARDKFLMEQISNNEGGWIPLAVLMTFKRLASITTNADTIVNAIQKSDEGLVEVSEDKSSLRRHPERPIPELNEERRKEISTRTVYVKGFPTNLDMSGIVDFFMPYEKIANIMMRKYLDKADKTYKFKGSVFVTFADKEHAGEFIRKEKVIYEERELIRKWQEDYFEEKKIERKEKPNQKGNKGKNAKEEHKISLPKGTVLQFDDAGEKVTREAIREAIEKIDGEWDIAYIDYSKGDKNGNIRLAVEDNASKLIEKLENNKLKLSIDGDDTEITLKTLGEEEEKEVLEKAVENIKSRRNQPSRFKNRKRHGGRDGNRNSEKKAKLCTADD